MKSPFGEQGFPQNAGERSAEREKLPTVVLAYRENDLFDEWIPRITAELEALGRKIERLPFKRGQQAEIEAWMADERNAESLKGKEVVTDRTVGRLLPKSLEAGKAEYLDRLLDLASTGATLSAEVHEAVGRNENADLELAGRTFVSLIRNAAMQAPPKEVLLVTDKLADHGPFKPGPDPFEAETQAMERIKGWLIEAGIEEGKIHVAGPWEDDHQGKQARKVFLRQGLGDALKGKSDVWCLSDRHSATSSLLKYEKDVKVSVLHMPLGDLFRDLESQGLLGKGAPDAAVLQQKIHEAIEKDFKPVDQDAASE